MLKKSVLIWCFYFLQSVIVSAGTFQYGAKGVLSYTNFLSKECFDINYDFFVRDKQWAIHANQFGVRHFGYTEIGCDSRNLYSITYYNKDAVEVARTNGLMYFVNGAVKPETIPTFDPVRSIHIWYAHYGFFKSPEENNSQVACRLLSQRKIPKCFRSINCLTNSPQSGKPIVVCEVKDEGYDYDADGTPRKLPPPFEKGYTAMRYEIYDLTNTIYGSVPLKYRFTAFLYTQNAKTTSNTVALWMLEGNVTNLQSDTLDDFKPKIVDSTYVFDYASPITAGKKDVDHVEYFTKSSWGAADIPNAAKDVQRDHHMPIKRTILIIFFCSSLIVLIFFFFKKNSYLS